MASDSKFNLRKTLDILELGPKLQNGVWGLCFMGGRFCSYSTIMLFDLDYNRELDLGR